MLIADSRAGVFPGGAGAAFRRTAQSCKTTTPSGNVGSRDRAMAWSNGGRYPKDISWDN